MIRWLIVTEIASTIGNTSWSTTNVAELPKFLDFGICRSSANGLVQAKSAALARIEVQKDVARLTTRKGTLLAKRTTRW